jgi:hypothetical protein
MTLSQLNILLVLTLNVKLVGLPGPGHLIELFIFVVPIIGSILGYNAGSKRMIGSTGGFRRAYFLAFWE